MLHKINKKKKKKINLQIPKEKIEFFKIFHFESFWGFQETHGKF